MHPRYHFDVLSSVGQREQIMASFNKVILIGNLTADPELKKTPNGISVSSFSIAVGRAKDRNQADFINIVSWRTTAEFITKYFQKGQPILIVGSLQSRSWTDHNGTKRYATEVIAEEAQFVERKRDKSDYPSAPYSSFTESEEAFDDELPY